MKPITMIRFIMSAFVAYWVYKETGPITGIFAGLMLARSEIDGILINRLITVVNELRYGQKEKS